MFAADDPKIISIRERIQIHRAERDGVFSIAECEKILLAEMREVLDATENLPGREVGDLLGLDLNQVYSIRSYYRIREARAKKKEIKFKEVKISEPPPRGKLIRFRLGGDIDVEVESAEVAATIFKQLMRSK